jgi:amidase
VDVTKANETLIDDPGTCEGMPTHVQVMGKPMMDEELIEVMKVVESVLKDGS